MGLGYGESWEEAARTGALGRSLDLLGRRGGREMGGGEGGTRSLAVGEEAGEGGGWWERTGSGGGLVRGGGGGGVREIGSREEGCDGGI